MGLFVQRCRFGHWVCPLLSCSSLPQLNKPILVFCHIHLGLTPIPNRVLKVIQNLFFFFSFFPFHFHFFPCFHPMLHNTRANLGTFVPVHVCACTWAGPGHRCVACFWWGLKPSPRALFLVPLLPTPYSIPCRLVHCRCLS